MPTYEYKCTQCSYRFEIFQKFSEDSLVECPRCGGTISKIFHVPPLVFKGTGWYVKDSVSVVEGEKSSEVPGGNDLQQNSSGFTEDKTSAVEDKGASSVSMKPSSTSGDST